MKKTSLILLSTLCALAANAVVDIPGSTSSTGRPVVKDIADGQDIRLLPECGSSYGSLEYQHGRRDGKIH